jgi:hypothetical protein
MQCEFSLIRYVPDPVKNEFVNIGVLLRPAGGVRKVAGSNEAAVAPAGVHLVKFTKDWARVRCVDPDADIAMLEAMENELRRVPYAGSGVPPLLKTIEDSFSHQLQITEPKACLAENAAAELDRLMQLYVEPRKLKGRASVTGRQAIARQMRTHFEHARVWDLMRHRIAASAYTRPGDSLKLDCGYRPNGVVRIFHAVSLATDVELAKVLAFSATALRAGVERVEKAGLELTAIVEPLRNGQGEVTVGDDFVEQYRFGVETMEAAQLRVLTVSDLERVAATAQRELRV